MNDPFTVELSRKSVALSRTSGFMSLLGSSVILYIIFSDRRNKLQRIHYRLLVGICCTDVIFSIACIVSTAAIPKDTPEIYHLYGNIGTETTCKVQGFFFQWGTLGLPFYMASLSLYFLLVIRYKMTDEDISRRIEPIMHCFSTLIPFALAVAGLCLNLYHNKLGMCWIEAKPFGCTHVKEWECEAGKHAPAYEVWFSFAWQFLVILFEIIVMCSIFLSVRNQERRLSAFAFRSSRNGRVLSESSTRASTETKDTAIQACLYIFAFLLTYVWPFGSYIMARFSKRMTRGYYLSIFFFYPLLGFWNFVAYIRPRYARISRSNRDKSILWKLKAMILAPTVEPGQSQRRDTVRGPARRASIETTESRVQAQSARLPKSRSIKRSFSVLVIKTKKRGNLPSDIPHSSNDPTSQLNVLIPESTQLPTLNISPITLDPSTQTCLSPTSLSAEEEDSGNSIAVDSRPYRRMSLIDIITKDVCEEDSESKSREV